MSKDEEIFNRHKSGTTWYSKFRVVTPAMTLAWAALNEPNNSYYEIQKAKENQKSDDEPLKLPPKMFRATLTCQNIDIVQERQPGYKKFMDKCQELVAAAIPEAKPEEINYPIRMVEPKEGDPYWSLDAKARADQKPLLYHAVRKEEIPAADHANLYDGCLAAFEGPLRISKFVYPIGGKKVPVYYVRVVLGAVYHIGEGERRTSKPKATDLDLSDYGVSSDSAIEQFIEEGNETV